MIDYPKKNKFTQPPKWPCENQTSHKLTTLSQVRNLWKVLHISHDKNQLKETDGHNVVCSREDYNMNNQNYKEMILWCMHEP
jgi:hypothetical protein